jgi:enamidase
MKTAIINIGTIVSGDWRDPLVPGDAILIDGERLGKVGTVDKADLDACDLVVDAKGVTAVPGFIDSHVHVAFGDYTPRLTAVGFLKDYLYGGTTTAISACEVHVPGRPCDPDGVKALAVTAKKCWDNLRPGGMRVHAGNIILEPGLTDADFQELAAKGIWLAKAGFGSVSSPFDYAPLMAAAKRAGMITNVHTGGASLSLANSIYGKHLVAMQPDVAFHVNGGPIAMPDEDFELVLKETKAALQICQAGNIRTALKTLNLAVSNDCFDRFLIATDTPTGIGVMPEGMVKSITEMACLSDYPAEWMIAAATGNVATVYRLNSGFLQPGRDADLLLIDAAFGAPNDTALSSIKAGDVPAGVACFTAGIPRYIGRSRCTPPPMRIPDVVKNLRPLTFEPPAMLH